MAQLGRAMVMTPVRPGPVSDVGRDEEVRDEGRSWFKGFWMVFAWSGRVVPAGVMTTETGGDGMFRLGRQGIVK